MIFTTYIVESYKIIESSRRKTLSVQSWTEKMFWIWINFGGWCGRLADSMPFPSWRQYSNRYFWSVWKVGGKLYSIIVSYAALFESIFDNASLSKYLLDQFLSFLRLWKCLGTINLSCYDITYRQNLLTLNYMYMIKLCTGFKIHWS